MLKSIIKTCANYKKNKMTLGPKKINYKEKNKESKFNNAKNLNKMPDNIKLNSCKLIV